MKIISFKEKVKERKLKLTHLIESRVEFNGKDWYVIWYKDNTSGYSCRHLIPAKVYQEYTEKNWEPSDLVVYYPEYDVIQFGQLLSYTVYKHKLGYLIIDQFHEKYMVGTLRSLFNHTVDESEEDLTYWLDPKNRVGVPKFKDGI